MCVYAHALYWENVEYHATYVFLNYHIYVLTHIANYIDSNYISDILRNIIVFRNERRS